MRKIERVLVSTFNTITEGKRLVIITEDRLSELLIDSKYYVYDRDLKPEVMNVIDLTRVYGFLDNFSVSVDVTTGIIKLYADFTITCMLKNLPTDFYIMTISEASQNDYINGDEIKMIKGWVLK